MNRLKKTVLIMLFRVSMLITSAKISFPGNITYDPFFAAQVTDSEGNVYRLSSLSFVPMLKEDSKLPPENHFFFWIRRGTEKGIASYTLDFQNIKSITFAEDINQGPEGYTPAQMELTSGQNFSVFINTDGYLTGIDEEFGVFVRLYLNYDMVSTIVFRQDGTYKRCPLCNTLFYDSDKELCPFDKTPLTPQITPR